MKNKLKFITEKSNYFTKSSYSMIFFVLSILLFSIIQIALFATGVTSVNGIYVYDQKSYWIWIIFFLSITSAITGLVGGVYANREDKRFLLWIIYADISCAISVYISGALLLSIVTLIMMALLFVRKKIWSNIEEENKYNTKKIKITILVSFVMLLSFVMIIIHFFGDVLYKDNINQEWVRYFDGVQAVLVLIASIFMIFKIKVSFVFYLLSCLFSIAFFASPNVNQIVPIVQLILFSMMYLSGLLSWNYQEE